MGRVSWLLLACCALGCEQEEEDGQKKPEAPPERRLPEPPAGWPPTHEDDRFRPNREWMVRTQIAARGVEDESVLEALRTVPRHRFVPGEQRPHAYEDRPLSIGHDQTISQPYIVAYMTELLKLERGHTVLEIGTGSGYQAAVLAQITPHVRTIEIKGPLAARAGGTLRRLGYATVTVKKGDGYYGWEEHGPFDAILVTAAAPHVPPPLVEQLRPGGRLVLPVGEPFAVQALRLVTKDGTGRVRSKSLMAVRFVPMTGSLGKKKSPD